MYARCTQRRAWSFVHFTLRELISSNDFQHQRNMAYTAVTRAKTSLSIYYCDSLPGYFDQALKSLEPPGLAATQRRVRAEVIYVGDYC